MQTISFYPGPSQLHESVGPALEAGLSSGIFAANHRSKAFMEMAAQTLQALRQKLDIPADYHITFTGSATECWEILAQSLPDTVAHHFFNGAFGERWHERSANIKGLDRAIAHPFGLGELPAWSGLPDPGSALLCFTQNETSNGTQFPLEELAKCRAAYPDALIAIDGTSSLGGLAYDWRQADFWYASVQKCLGLPAGLGLMVTSPAGAEAVRLQDPMLHYNSLAVAISQMQDFQTPYTPNVLGIYLLGQVMVQNPPIAQVDAHLRKRAANATARLADMGFAMLSPSEANHSATVLTIKTSAGALDRLFEQASAHGLIIGKGYKPLKGESFRLANFPAVPDAAFDRLWILLQLIKD